MVSKKRSHKRIAEKLQSILDGDQADIRNEARQFATELAADEVNLSMQDHRNLTVKNVKAIADQGYARMPYPTEYGGLDQGQEFLNFVEVLSHGDLSTVIKQGVNFGLFGMSVSRLGTEKHNEGFLPDIMTGNLLGGFAMTELDGGSNVQGIETTAVYDKDTDSFVINTPHEGARKAYIGNAALHGQMMVVFAQLQMSDGEESEGVHAFMVPIRDRETGKLFDGIEIEDHGKKVGLNGVDNGIIGFDNVSIPRDMMLDRFASVTEDGDYKSDIESKSKRFFTMIGTLVTGRIFVSLSSLSAAKNALTQAIKNSESREVFGEALIDMQATQRSLFPKLAEAYALHFATRDLIAESNDIGSRSLETKAAALKARASDFAFDTIDAARTNGGGEGYIAKHRFGQMRDDVDVYRTFEGDNTVLRLFTAKNLLDELKTEFASQTSYRRLLKGLSMTFKGAAARFNPEKLDASSDHMSDPHYYLKMIRLREDMMRMELARKVMKLSKKLGGPKQAFDQCQEDALALADAYTARIMAEKFVGAVNEQDDPEVKAVLQDLCDLYAVHTMRENAHWYLEKELMTSRQTHKLKRVENKLSQTVRENAQDYVDAFAIPDVLLPERPSANMTRRQKPQGPSLKLH